MFDVAGRIERVDGLRDAVLPAAAGQAGSGPEQRIGDGAVGVVDDGERDVGDICREHQAGVAEVDILAADMLGQRRALGDGEVRDGDVPHPGCYSYECVRGGVVDVGAEVSGVGRVKKLWALPADCHACAAGKERRTGNVARTRCPRGYGAEEQCQQ